MEWAMREPPEEGKGRESVLSFVTGLLHIFPNLQHELDSVTACGNSVQEGRRSNPRRL